VGWTKGLSLLAGLGGFALVFSQSAPKRNHPYASGEPINKPVLFGEGVISTGDYDSHPAFMPDGRTLYFVKSTPAFTFWTIVVSHFRDGQWTTPEVAPFSGQFSDADPHITSDGKHLYFISNRPVPGKAKRDLDIWVIDSTETGWSAPRNLGAPINSDGNESSDAGRGRHTLLRVRPVRRQRGYGYLLFAPGGWQVRSPPEPGRFNQHGIR